MNLLILGATGRVGCYVLAHALRDGHQVTAMVRSPEKLSPAAADNLRVIPGNVLQKADVELAMNGVDAVVSALGTDGTTTLSEGMPLIIDAMKQNGIARIVTVGTAGILQSRTSPELLRYQSSESKRKLTRAAEEHHKVYSLLDQSNLDWTIVCPTYLPDGTRVGSYRVEAHHLPEGGAEISVPDTADFTYSQLFARDYLRARVGIAY
jgi:putative NADH-flavin reductase